MAARATRGIRAVARETWNTNPDALLAALSSAEQAELARRSPTPRVREVRSVHSVAPPAPDLNAEPQRAPALRDDERAARPSGFSAVTVIIRRRRAA
jgi:hypothetical protein